MDEASLDRLEGVYHSNLKNELILRKKFLGTIYSGHYLMCMGSRYHIAAWRAYFIEKDIEKCKDFLWLKGKCALTRALISTSLSGAWLFEVARTLISEVALSDNQELINDFVTFDYEKRFVNAKGTVRLTSFSHEVLNGEQDIYHDAMLSLMGKDLNRLERDLKIMKDITLKKKMNSWMELDYKLFEAILNSNIAVATEVLNEFVSKKIHKSRNRHELYPELLSFPALGYAKLCWINGLEVKINSPFLPIDMLQIHPLSTYSDFEQIFPSKYINKELYNRVIKDTTMSKVLKWLIGK